VNAGGRLHSGKSLFKLGLGLIFERGVLGRMCPRTDALLLRFLFWEKKKYFAGLVLRNCRGAT